MPHLSEKRTKALRGEKIRFESNQNQLRPAAFSEEEEA